jgi:hypothetical protein
MRSFAAFAAKHFQNTWRDGKICFYLDGPVICFHIPLSEAT